MMANRADRSIASPRLWLLLACLTAAPATAAEEARYSGNLDVPYVPTHQATVEAMLRLAGVGPGDFVIDLGLGRRPHTDYGREEVRSARLRGRSRSTADKGKRGERERRRGVRSCPVPSAQPLRYEDRRSERRDPLPPAAGEHRAAAAPAGGVEARHARRFARFRHGRLEARPARDGARHERHRLLLARSRRRPQASGSSRS